MQMQDSTVTIRMAHHYGLRVLMPPDEITRVDNEPGDCDEDCDVRPDQTWPVITHTLRELSVLMWSADPVSFA